MKCIWCVFFAVAAILPRPYASAAEPKSPERVLFLCAHPDDIISSLGTCLLMRGKFEVHVVDFTHGERGLGEAGFRDGSTKATRIKEEESVCAAIGAKLHWLDQVDGESYVTPGTCRKLADLIRSLAPRAVFGHWPIDVHPDHMMSAATLQKAMALSDYKGECYFFEESFDSKGFPAVHYVDITSVMKEKERIIRLYACQNANDEMCREEMDNSHMRAANLYPALGWPPRAGAAEAFAPYVGRTPDRCIFTEIPRRPAAGK